jgi:hypothetical protein
MILSLDRVPCAMLRLAFLLPPMRQRTTRDITEWQRAGRGWFHPVFTDVSGPVAPARSGCIRCAPRRHAKKTESRRDRVAIAPRERVPARRQLRPGASHFAFAGAAQRTAVLVRRAIAATCGDSRIGLAACGPVDRGFRWAAGTRSEVRPGAPQRSFASAVRRNGPQLSLVCQSASGVGRPVLPCRLRRCCLYALLDLLKSMEVPSRPGSVVEDVAL